MLVYDGTKIDFLNSVVNDTIATEIENNIYNKLNRHTAWNEFRSWENSLEYMYKVLNDEEIPNDAGIAIEYNIPQTSKRVDFIISGYNASEDPNVVIIELKQWDQIKEVKGEDALVETYTGNALRKVVHPSYQAWSYSMLIKDYNQSVQDGNIKLSPCAFLHNYRREVDDVLDKPQYQLYLEEAPAFTRGEVPKLREFIKKSVKKGDNREILYLIDNGKIKPSKSLQDSIAKLLRGNKEFIMIDDQKVVYEQILSASEKCTKDQKKRTIIVQGGPGTGKTVVAVNLLAELTQRDQVVQYVSKNSAPRSVYLKKLKGQMKKSSVDNLFKGSGDYTKAEDNFYNTLLVDEAHRLNEKSGMFKNLGENQIKEIIHASLCSVFFIDENQRVTLSDIGSVEEIEKWAKYEGSEVTYMELKSQFRCNGSDGYLAWVDDVLDIRETANYNLDDIDYDIRICDTPNEMRDLIFERNKIRNSARILAGYCWDWISEGKNNTDIHD
ncbi:MAG: DNA/RNA helicase domain-containing protein, partial [Bacilli bacterium]